MAYKQKIIRTLRCKNKKAIGTLAKLTTTISALGGEIGEIHTVSMGELHNVRDISIVCSDEHQLEHILAAVELLPEVHIEQVIDDVLALHQGGKLQTVPRYPVHSIDELRKVYTPGVAAVSRLIKDDPSKAQIYTGIGRTVALITNGTRVLGLGPIGPVAAMPVMEGKAALFTQFTGYQMIPILVNTTKVKDFVATVKNIACGFSAIQLEDIATPACYEIEEILDKDLPIPVMHDDQHGTAVVTLAAAINACRLVGVDIKKACIGQIGLGAAGSSIARLLMAYTGNPVLGVDVRKFSLDRHKKMGGIVSSLEEIMKKSELVIATTGQEGMIKPDMVRKGQVILALSNPMPEITIEAALKAGAAFASDGSRVNNLLGYPGILKGAMDSHARQMTREMYVAAAEVIANKAPEKELIPDPLDMSVHDSVAKAVAREAIACGVAGILLDRDYFKDTDDVDREIVT